MLCRKRFYFLTNWTLVVQIIYFILCLMCTVRAQQQFTILRENNTERSSASLYAAGVVVDEPAAAEGPAAGSRADIDSALQNSGADGVVDVRPSGPRPQIYGAGKGPNGGDFEKNMAAAPSREEGAR